MKINALMHSEAISKYANNVSGTTKKTAVTANISDTVELSEGAQKYSELIKQAKEAMEKSGTQEEAKTADIISRMNAGTYQVSTDDIVGSMFGSSPSNG